MTNFYVYPFNTVAWLRQLCHLMAIIMLLITCEQASANGLSGSAISVKTPTETVLTRVYNSPSTLTLGRNRLIIRAVDERDRDVLSGPDVELTLRLTQGSEQLDSKVDWVWLAEPYNGFYVSWVQFDRPGAWRATLMTKDGPLVPFELDVLAAPTMPTTGQEAPRSVSKVLSANVPLSSVTTDPAADPSLYTISIAGAVTSGYPSIIAFATPAFCRTKNCGPVLREVKKLRADYPNVKMVHVEIYDWLGRHSGGNLPPVDAVIEWRLPSEPWVFVVDAAGRIAAGFEGFATRAEISREIDRLLD